MQFLVILFHIHLRWNASQNPSQTEKKILGSLVFLHLWEEIMKSFLSTKIPRTTASAKIKESIYILFKSINTYK